MPYYYDIRIDIMSTAGIEGAAANTIISAFGLTAAGCRNILAKLDLFMPLVCGSSPLYYT